MRLINADKLLDAMYEETGIMTEFRSDYETLVDEQPTVDAQPVVHGKWENVNPVEVPLYRCSVCGHTPTVIKTNFCSDCGARME